jgi:hypothetical protein
MRLSVSKLFVGLVAIGQLACALTIYPRALSNLTTEAPLLCQGESPLCDHHAAGKRMNNDAFSMSKPDGWGNTWVAYIQEPSDANPPWTTGTIRGFARDGYHQIESMQPITIVTALWFPGIGVWIGTIPHDSRTYQFRENCPVKAPRLWTILSGRTLTGQSTTLWHAEDMAMFEYEKSRPASNKGYPEGGYMASYGRRFNSESARPQPPCSGQEANITPSCLDVLRRLDIRT